MAETTRDGGGVRNGAPAGHQVDVRRHTIDSLRKLADKIHRDANGKKGELREYVGLRYRDLLRSVDAILSMKEQCRKGFDDIQSLTSTLNNLSKRNLADQKARKRYQGETKKVAKSGGERDDKNYGESRKRLLAKRVESICSAPELAWGMLAEGRYMDACTCYFEHKIDYMNVIGGAKDLLNEAAEQEDGDVSSNHSSATDEKSLAIPDRRKDGKETTERKLVLFVIQQWECLQNIPAEIKEKCTEMLLKLNLTAKEARDCLGALAFITAEAASSSLSSSSSSSSSPSFQEGTVFSPSILSSRLLDILLKSRLRLIELIFESAMQVLSRLQGKESNQERVLSLVCSAIRDVTETVVHAIELVACIFVRTSDELSLSSSPEGGDDKRVAYEKMQLPSKEVSQKALLEWLAEVQSIFKSGLPKLLQAVTRAKDLSRVNASVFDVLYPDYESLKKTNQEDSVAELALWQDAMSEVLVDPPDNTSQSSPTWKSVPGSIQGHQEAIMWNYLFADVVCERSGAIIDFAFQKLHITPLIQEAIDNIFGKGSDVFGDPSNSGDMKSEKKSFDVGSEEWDAKRQGDNDTGNNGADLETSASDWADTMVWKDLTAWVGMIKDTYLQRTREVIKDLGYLLMMMNDAKILSLNKLVRFVLKPRIQKACSMSISELVKSIRMLIQSLESSTLDMSHKEHKRSAEMAVFLAQTAEGLAGFHDEVTDSIEFGEDDIEEEASKFMTETFKMVGDVGSSSLLRAAYSGFRMWTRFMGSYLSGKLKPEFESFVRDHSVEVDLKRTWQKMEIPNQKGHAQVPICPSPYALNLLLWSCSEIYRITGSDTRPGFLMCAKLDISEHIAKVLQEALERLQALPYDTWKQLCFDVAFLFSALETSLNGKQEPGKGRSAVFSAEFVVTEAREDYQSCLDARKKLKSLIETHVDPIEFEYMKGMIGETEKNFRRSSNVLFGALRVLGDSSSNSFSITRTKKARDEQVVRTIAFAQTADHTPLLPTSLYPKRKVVQPAIVVPKPAVRRQSEASTRANAGKASANDIASKGTSMFNIRQGQNSLLDLVMRSTSFR